MEQKTPKEEKSGKSIQGIISKVMPIKLSIEDKRKNNEEVLHKLELGDLVKFRRSCYDHWAVYIGEDDVLRAKSVIHWWKGTHEQCTIRIDPFWDVAMDDTVEKDNPLDNKYPDHYKGKDVVERARLKLNDPKKGSYNIVFNNCEHFAKWCRYGVKESIQVETAMNQILKPVVQEAVHSAIAMFGATTSNTEGKHTMNIFDSDSVGTFGAAQTSINKCEEQEKETSYFQGSDTRECQE